MVFVRVVRVLWDRIAAGVIVASGLVALLLGYSGVSGTVYPAEQFPYVLSGGVLGAMLVGVGATLWLSADLRDEWRKLDRIEALLQAQAEGSSAPDESAEEAQAPTAPEANGAHRSRRARLGPPAQERRSVAGSRL